MVKKLFNEYMSFVNENKDLTPEFKHIPLTEKQNSLLMYCPETNLLKKSPVLLIMKKNIITAVFAQTKELSISRQETVTIF